MHPYLPPLRFTGATVLREGELQARSLAIADGRITKGPLPELDLSGYLILPGIIAGCLLVFLPAMGMFYVSDLLGGAKHLLIGNLIKTQFLNSRDWPFGAAISVMLTVLMALLVYCYWRAGKLLSKKGELA